MKMSAETDAVNATQDEYQDKKYAKRQLRRNHL